MIKHLMILSTTALLPLAVYASDETNTEDNTTKAPEEETIIQKSSLTANLKRLAVQYNQNSVTNKNDNNYPGTFTSDEQEVFTFVFDGNVEYDLENMVWLNSLFAEYGQSESNKKGEKTKSENADKILFTTDYTQKIWKLDEGIVGPFANLGYQTEFTTFEGDDGKNYRTKIIRGKTGVKLYEGKYFKELYAAAVEEADFTYGDTNMKTAAEIGYQFEYQIRDDMKFVSDGFFRKFFIYDMYRNTDYKYEFETNNRLDVTIVGNFSFAPFFNYKLAKTRGAKKERSDTTVGLSLGYQTDYKFW